MVRNSVHARVVNGKLHGQWKVTCGNVQHAHDYVKKRHNGELHVKERQKSWASPWRVTLKNNRILSGEALYRKVPW